MKFGSLQVRTPDGVAREFPIDLPSLVVGRADGNGIVIDDLSISRRHARIVIESGRLIIEDLGSAAGTFVGGHRIDPGTSNLVEGDQDIRFGDVSAQFVPPAATSASEAEAGIAALADADAYPDIEEAPSRAISITLTSPATPVEPGGAVFASAVIHNRGRVVDLITLGVTGIPSSWVTFSHATLALVPGTRETITMVIQPPLHADSLAGEYDFGLVVNSGEHEREGVAFGKLQVLPFDAAELHLQPMRSKRDFVLVAKNNGNALVTFVLSGSDEEGRFIYDFDAPSIELQAGQEKRMPLRVRKKKRQFFGRTSFAPIRIIATPSTGTGVEVETPGQILLVPPLERWKAPAILAFLLGIIGTAIWFSYVYSDHIPTWIPWSTKTEEVGLAPGNPEAAYAGVHMCEKSPEERQKLQAKVTPPPAGTTGAPLFAQNNPTWAKDEYAKAQDPEFGPDWCGTTIEQCGCAMTSVATIMAIFNIMTMPDGSELTPQTVNAWFNSEARKTSRGWVSKGYIYGDVIWTAANELSGQIAKQRPGSPTLRFAGFGTGSEEEIRAELQAGRPLVLEVPGHYIAAVGITNDNKIQINDPYYPDKLTLDAYKGLVKSSVKFEPSNDLSAVVITVPKDLRVRVLDKQGKIVGSLNADEGTAPAPVGITGAYLSSRNAWRDPTCVESPPPAGAGTTSIFLPGNREDYRIEVLNPSSGGTSVAIHSYDQEGDAAVQTQDSTGQTVLGMAFDPTTPIVQVEIIQGSPPGATDGTGTPAGGTPQLPSGGNNGGGAITNPTVGTTPVPSVSPTPTRTPVPTPTPIAPAAVQVQCTVAFTPSPPTAGVTCTGAVTGTYTTTRWTINGLPAPVPPGSTAFNTTFSQDTTATVEMTACNVTVCRSGSTPVVVKFTSPTPTPSGTPVPGTPTPVPTAPPVGPPLVVNVNCVYAPAGSLVQIDCATAFLEAYNTITWSTTGGATPPGEAGGAKQFQTFAPYGSTITVQATVCLGAQCTVSNIAVVTVTATPTPVVMALNLVIDVPNPACPGGPGSFPITAYFDGYSGGPLPTGSISFSTSDPMGFPSQLIPIQGAVFGAFPGAVRSDVYFESYGIFFTVTAVYNGDANYAGDSAQVTFEVMACGG